MLLRIAFFCLIAFLPVSTEAMVRLHEIAWMGGRESANDEWIELHNDGDTPVSLNGWRLEANDGSPIIALSGTIAAGGYFLLERSDDSAVPSVSASQLYTGALGNDGEVLTLFDEAGTQADVVDGSDAWALGGDNASKDTLGRTASGAWATTPPTPGRANAAASAAVSGGASSWDNAAERTASGEEKKAQTTAPKKKENESVKMVDNKQRLLSLEVPDDMIVPLGVAAQFVARLYDEDGEEYPGGSVSWNFGDGSIETGKAVTHAWKFPGTYLVHVEGKGRLFSNPLYASARFRVEVTSAQVELVAATSRFIELRNHEAYEVDLSGFTVRQGSKRFTIPEHTVLLAGASIRFSKEVTGLTGSAGVPAVLHYPSGERVVVSPPAPEEEFATAAAQAAESETTAEDTVRTQNALEASEYRAPMLAPSLSYQGETATGSEFSETALAASVALGEELVPERSGSLLLWLFLLLGVIGAGATALILLARERELVVEGYRVIDTTDETKHHTDHESRHGR